MKQESYILSAAKTDLKESYVFLYQGLRTVWTWEVPCGTLTLRHDVNMISIWSQNTRNVQSQRAHPGDAVMWYETVFGKTCESEKGHGELQSLQLHSCHMTKTQDAEQYDVIIWIFFFFAYPQIGWMSEFTLCQSSIVANTEDWPLLDTEGSCGGQKVEQRGKKKNIEWCSASWITAHVDSQFVMINRNLLYVSLSMSIQKTWTGYVASRSLFSLYLATHYQLFTAQISWGMRL